jgi:hypothetical protein
MKRELLLLFKTNNYLRAIDLRLKSPGNTFTLINKITWQVYKDEILPKECNKMPLIKRNVHYLKAMISFYVLQTILWLQYFGVRIKTFFGVKISLEELKDFELDAIEFEQI